MDMQLQEVLAIGGVLLVVFIYLFSRFRNRRNGLSNQGCASCSSTCEQPDSSEKTISSETSTG